MFGWCAYVHTCALLKWPPLPVLYKPKRSSSATKQFQEKIPTYFLTSIRRWVCELAFDAIYDWRSSRITDRMTDPHDNYCNPRCTCTLQVNQKLVWCMCKKLYVGDLLIFYMLAYNSPFFNLAVLLPLLGLKSYFALHVPCSHLPTLHQLTV